MAAARVMAARTRVWAAARSAVALLILAAIITQAAVTIGGSVSGRLDVVTIAVNFFSFFTILSNAGAVVVLLWAAVWLVGAGQRGREPTALALALASVSAYMIVTGLVYNVLLRSIVLPQGTTVWWSNEVLHVVGPLFLLADLLAAPGRRRLGWQAVWVALGFPVLWVVYTLIRGPFITNPLNGNAWWYPYPFLDPHTAMTDGYLGVAGYVCAIAITIMLVAAGIMWASRRRTP